jgi:hypothetical protein
MTVNDAICAPVEFGCAEFALRAERQGTWTLTMEDKRP